MKGRLLRSLSAFVLALAIGQVARAELTEYQLKAVFLLNFARYVEWPADKLPVEDAIELCVLGRDPFGGALSTIDGKQAQGHVVRVRLLSLPEQAEACHLLFLAGSEERRLGAALRALGELPVLTVSDIDGFVEAGGGIGFAMVDDRVRFDINARALEGANLKASAQLMKIARTVIGLGGKRQ
ncbi:MAG: YfiR family protein [Rhodocyclaceae bacterium]|nr:YfiR family protein [Rhodocyclaceae bacterium]